MRIWHTQVVVNAAGRKTDGLVLEINIRRGRGADGRCWLEHGAKPDVVAARDGCPVEVGDDGAAARTLGESGRSDHQQDY